MVQPPSYKGAATGWSAGIREPCRFDVLCFFFEPVSQSFFRRFGLGFRAEDRAAEAGRRRRVAEKPPLS